MIQKIRKYLELKRKIRFPRLSRSDIDAIQFRKLKTIVEHAYKSVPYYRALFKKHRFSPGDLRTLEDIRKIPLTSKKDLLSLDKAEITSNAFKENDLYMTKSSGTTGEPFSFYMDKKYMNSIGLEALRAMMLHGYRLTDKVIKISGEREDLHWLRSPLNLFFLKTVSFSSFSDYRKIVDFYDRFKPGVLRGYITSLFALATWLDENSIRLEHKPKFMHCSAETVHDFMREKVSKVFHSRIIDRYATIELGTVAVECVFGGYHIFEDSVLAEVVEISGGKYFVGTNLNNFATPFIRYNTSDICEPWQDGSGACRCGMKTKKISRITGRDNDFIKTPGGGLLSPADLLFFMRTYYPYIDKFRFVQDDERSLRLDIVLRGESAEENLNKLRDRFSDIGRGLVLGVNATKDIPKDKSGKMRIISSKV
jgi:phenylacetate-CoA ligase